MTPAPEHEKFYIEEIRLTASLRTSEPFIWFVRGNAFRQLEWPRQAIQSYQEFIARARATHNPKYDPYIEFALGAIVQLNESSSLSESTKTRILRHLKHLEKFTNVSLDCIRRIIRGEPRLAG